MGDPPRNEATQLSAPDSWAGLLALLSNCLGRPDEALETAVTSGSVQEDVERLAEATGIDVPSDQPTAAELSLTEDFEALFGAYRTPFAPPAASPYKEWYGDQTQGLMEGPPATRMEERLEALSVSVPAAYPADHVALQLEYASLLAEAGEHEELSAFVETELDWIDAFAGMVEEATAPAPFHRWSVSLLTESMVTLRGELGVTGPTEEQIETMMDRVRPTVT